LADAQSIKSPLWFKIATALVILWSLAGAFACYSQLTLTPAQLAVLPAAQRDAFIAMPLVVRIAYVIAVGGSLIGGILLILRRREARMAFVASLIGVVIQFGWVFGVYQGVAKMGTSALAFPAFIVLACIVEIWLAVTGRNRGWLG
jgi:hypothetical protein